MSHQAIPYIPCPPSGFQLPVPQFVILGQDGDLVEDPNSTLNPEIFKNDPFFQSIPLLVQGLEGENPKIELPCVGLDLPGFEGIFDFVISPLDNEEQHLVLEWIMLTSHYEGIREIQQTRNDHMIDAER